MLIMVCRTTVSTLVYSILSVSIPFRTNLMSKTILEQFGERVRAERLRQGISQEELAARSGVHRTYIGMIERAEKNITLKNIIKIAEALGVKPSSLLD